MRGHNFSSRVFAALWSRTVGGCRKRKHVLADFFFFPFDGEISVVVLSPQACKQSAKRRECDISFFLFFFLRR